MVRNDLKSFIFPERSEGFLLVNIKESAECSHAVTLFSSTIRLKFGLSFCYNIYFALHLVDL